VGVFAAASRIVRAVYDSVQGDAEHESTVASGYSRGNRLRGAV